jgi:hypothetical protein
MKKLYVLGALVLSGSLLNAQSKLGLQKNEALQYTASGNQLKIKTQSINSVSLAKRKAAAFWSEDFSNGFDGQGSNGTWTQSGTANSTTGIVPEWEYRGPNTTPDNTTGSRGSCVGTRGPITSNSVDNGFMIFDSNFWDEPLPNNCAGLGSGQSPRPHQSALVSPSIDFSAQPEVQLFFTTYSRNFQAEMNISVIADGDTTLVVDLYSFIELAANAQTLTDQLVGLDISALAGGKSDVKIMWNFEGDYYFFTMDDVFFDEIPDYDYNIVEVWNDDITDYYEYYDLPLSQSHIITPGINVNSRGTEPVDLELIINIQEPNGNIQGPFSQILSSFPKDSASGAIYIPTFKPTQLGVHTITYKVTTPNDANDLDTLNNTATRRFNITNDLWSDAFSENISFAFFAPTIDNAPGENETFQTFYTYEDVMVSGIDFLITNDDREPDNQTFEFDEVEVSVYTADKDLLASSIEAGTVLKSEVFTKETSSFLEVEEQHIGDPDNFIINSIAFEDVISVGKDNVFAISLYNSGGGYLTITTNSPNNNSDLSGITRARGLLATPGSATDDELFFFSNSNPYLRAHTHYNYNSVNENNRLNSNLNTAPNPSNNSTNISFTLESSSTATVTVKDLLGKEIYNSTNNFNSGRNIIELNTAAFQNGIYFYSVSVNGKTDTKKLVVQH